MGHTAQTDSSDLAPGSAAPAQTEEQHIGSFAPLRIPLFRDRWIAATVSGVGTWMQDTAGTWLMTVLTPSPLLIALMQTAASLPVLDSGSCRSHSGHLRPPAAADLLADVDAGFGCDPGGTDLQWCRLSVHTAGLHFSAEHRLGHEQSCVAGDRARAGAAGSDPASGDTECGSNNIARAVGPALGGLMVAAFLRADTGAGWVFALNSASFVAVIWMLGRWKRLPMFKRPACGAHLRLGAFRFALFAPRAGSARAADSRLRLHILRLRDLGPAGSGCEERSSAGSDGIRHFERLSRRRGCGGGDVAGEGPAVRRADALLATTSVYYIVSLLVLALVRSPWAVIPALLGAGFCWTSTMSTLNVSVQLSVPRWVHARALGLYLMTFQGGLALGSVVWGAIAQRSSVRIALVCAACGLAASLPFTLRVHILKGSLPDLTPYKPNRPLPKLRQCPSLRMGRCRISVDYTVPAENYTEFTHAIHELKGVRLRDGAIRWGVYRDAANPAHVNETFIMESWLDYLRSRERVTAADQAIREKVWALHKGDGPPKITHGVWAEEIPEPTPSPRLFGAKSSEEKT